ncbi:MAG: efflux RND transporter periplasmic adaptor subunit [Pseudomonadota bacterium]
MSKRLLSIGIIALILTGAVFGALSMSGQPENQSVTPTEPQAPLVNILELSAGTVHFTVPSQGTVNPVTEATLSAEIAGTVVALSDDFVAGGRFRAGQMLMQIDPTNYEVAVKRAQAALRQRQVEYDGAKKLREQGYRAEAELLSAEAALESAKADLVRAERDLERTEVRVPFDGLVRARNTELGNYVAPGSVLGTVFATDVFEVRLPLPDSELAFVELPSVSQGDAKSRPSVTLIGRYRGQPASWSAQVIRTEGVVDERTRMVFAVAAITDPYQLGTGALETPAKPLPAGTFVKADIGGISIDDVVKIPRTLIRGDSQVVFMDTDNLLRLRDLTFLRTDADYAYVDASQLEEMVVVLTVLETPLNGMAVRPNRAIEELPMEDVVSSDGAVESDVVGDAS